MFGKKSKKDIEISAPLDFKHIVHTGVDREKKLYGLPPQWMGIIGPESDRRAVMSYRSPTQRSAVTLERPSELGHQYNARPVQVGQPTAANGVGAVPMRQPYQDGSFGSLSPPERTSQYNYSPLTAQERLLPAESQVPQSYGSPSLGYDNTAASSPRPNFSPPAQTTRPVSQLGLGTSYMDAIHTLVDPGDPTQMLVQMQQIAEGSTSTVWRAVERESGYMVAVKRLNIPKQQRKELLVNELSVMKQAFNHENIVNFYSSFLVNDEVWIVMEFMDVGPVTNVLRQDNMMLQEDQIGYISKCTLNALAFLHELGVVHRDVKSDSVLLMSDGSVKLSDFGFCARVSRHVRRRSLVGTPYWMAPEIIARSPYGCESDVWSMGIFVVEMIDGEPPFFDDPPLQAMRKIRDNSPPPSIKQVRHVSRPLLLFVERMLERDIAHRPAAHQLLLDPFLHIAGDKGCIMRIVYRR